MSAGYTILKTAETKAGRVSMVITDNALIPFIVTAIYKDAKPRDVKCISLKHAEFIFHCCSRPLYQSWLVSENGMPLDIGRA